MRGGEFIIIKGDHRKENTMQTNSEGHRFK